MTRLRTAVSIGAAALCSLAFAAPAMGTTFTVNSTGDLTDPTLNGICDTDPAGTDGTPCTLRAAIAEANNDDSLDEITFSVSGTHTLGSQISILDDLIIDGNGSGNGASDTIIDGADLTNLFVTSSDPVTFKNVRLANARRNAGGAAVELNGDGTFENATVADNETFGTNAFGGAITSPTSTATLTITDSDIRDNTQTGTGDNFGAGVYSGGPLVLTNSTVSGNSITGGGTVREGAGVYADFDIDIEGSTISGNSGAVQGGGILVDNHNLGGTRSIENSTISGNSAGNGGGGGIFTRMPLTIDGSTFAANTTSGVGGDDIYSLNQTVTVTGSILGSSSTQTCGSTAANIVSGGNSIDIGDSCGFGTDDGNQENTDADLGPLQVNAPGTTATHDIAANGPAMNTAGDCASTLPTDQRGVERPQGEACDVGSFELEHQSLSVTRVGSGTVTGTGINCPMDCNEAEPVGTQITLTPTPEAGFTFTGWSGDCTGTGACVVTLSEDRAVTATFTSNKNVSVSTAGTGSGSVTGTQVSCPGDCAGSYIHGTVLVLTAAAGSGSTFTSWSGCDSTAGPQCTLNMTSDRLVTATFTADPVTPPPGGGPTPTPKKCKKGFVKKKGKCVKKKRKKK